MSEDQQTAMHVALSVPVNIDQDAVLREAARIVVRKVYPGVDTESKAREQVKAEVVDYVREHLAKVLVDVTAQLEEMKFPQTNGYGESIGRERTIREFVAEQAERWLTMKVDVNGNPSGYSSGIPRGEWLVSKAVNAQVTAVLKTKIDEVVVQALATVEKSLAEHVQNAIGRAIGTKK